MNRRLVIRIWCEGKHDQLDRIHNEVMELYHVRMQVPNCIPVTLTRWYMDEGKYCNTQLQISLTFRINELMAIIS